jgi:integrase
MGRPAAHIITRDHPSPRFRDKIRLHQFRRGPTDDIWCATYRIDGRWETRKPVSLATRIWDDAIEVARDKYALLVAGQPVVRTYTKATPAPAMAEHAFKLYADKAIAALETLAAQADAGVHGKGHVSRDIARRVRDDLVPRWGTTDIRTLDEHSLNEWIKRDYRVEDVEATVKRYGRQPRNSTREKVFKKPSITTLGNLDWALRHVWLEAVEAKIVDRRQRPMIDKSLGEDGEPRAFVDEAGVQAVMRVMTDQWVAAPPVSGRGHTPDMKRMLRCYLTLIACTGIRAGLECKRILIGNVRFLVQHDRPVILIHVVKHQGKHRGARRVIVFEGDHTLPIRGLLHAHIAWRRDQGATDRDYLFAWPNGSFPVFRDALDTVLTQANALTDPITGEKRVAYSFRHYFATKLIGRGLSVAQVAEWLGTSSAMIERHYNQHIMERDAHLLNGTAPLPVLAPDQWESFGDVEINECLDRGDPDLAG